MIDNYLEDKTTILNPEGYLTVVVENGSVNKKIPDRFYIEFIIGRDSECDIQFSDSVVSRKHARVFWKSNKWWIKDLESSNGTYINRKKIIEEILLPPKKQVEFCLGGPNPNISPRGKWV